MGRPLPPRRARRFRRDGGTSHPSRLATSWLYGLSARDPLTVAAAILGMTLVAALAGYLPARRSAEVEPLTALRSD